MKLSSVCMKCGKELTNDEIGAYRKMVNRGALEFLCKSCLAAWFDCEEELIDQKIAQFKRMGCSLFASETD